MRVVLDTNVLLVSIGRQSPFRPIYNALLRQHLVLVVSTGILLEYEEILAQRNGPVVAQNVLDALENLRNVRRHEVRYNWRLLFSTPTTRNSWMPMWLGRLTIWLATTAILVNWQQLGFRRYGWYRQQSFWRYWQLAYDTDATTFYKN